MLKIPLIFILMLSAPSFADTTGKGKVIFTQGHNGPTCRTVLHKVNNTGEVKYFRIPNVPGNDIQRVLLAALMANRDVDIYYQPNETTGCGTEPAIGYVTIF
jgi:hypothetical protein